MNNFSSMFLPLFIAILGSLALLSSAKDSTASIKQLSNKSVLQAKAVECDNRLLVTIPDGPLFRYSAFIREINVGRRATCLNRNVPVFLNQYYDEAVTTCTPQNCGPIGSPSCRCFNNPPLCLGDSRTRDVLTDSENCKIQAAAVTCGQRLLITTPGGPLYRYNSFVRSINVEKIAACLNLQAPKVLNEYLDQAFKDCSQQTCGPIGQPSCTCSDNPPLCLGDPEVRAKLEENENCDLPFPFEE